MGVMATPQTKVLYADHPAGILLVPQSLIAQVTLLAESETLPQVVVCPDWVITAGAARAFVEGYKQGRCGR